MNNITEIIQMLRRSSNPQQLALNMLQMQSKDNPMVNMVLQMAQGNNSAGLEQITRNLCKEKNIDYDKAIQQIRQQFGC